MHDSQNIDPTKLAPDLDNWCDHWLVSLRSWQCPDCNRPLNDIAQRRLLSAPIVAPKGHLWILQYRTQDGFEQEDGLFDVVHVFTNRNQIPRQAIKDRVYDANSLRQTLQQIHWYQSVFNICIFEGWEENTTDDFPTQYRLSLLPIDSCE